MTFESGTYLYTANELTAMRLRSRRAAGEDTGARTGWYWSKLDFHALLGAFPLLSLAPGVKLVGLGHRDSMAGSVGVRVAPAGFMVESVPLDGYGVDSRSPLTLPELVGLDRKLMRAIRGDGSLEAFTQAVIFALEASSLGNYWHAIGFDVETILDLETPPIEASPYPNGFATQPWRWLDAPSEGSSGYPGFGREPSFEQLRPARHMDMRPRAILTPHGAEVMFYSASSYDQYKIQHCLAEFGRDSLDFAWSDHAVALGEGGWIT